MRITSIQARQILDSRGNPTVECSLALADGKSVLASVPSGASTGSHEAHEVRDGGSLYRGKGVLHAIKNIEEIIAPALVGKAPDVVAADATMLALDGTGNCDSLGANAMLAVSVAVLRAQAATENLELFQFINQRWAFPAPRLPQCMFNLINGGMHAQGSLAFQEFLIMPQTGNFEEDLALADAVYYALKDLLEQKGRGSAVGDEGGFVPSFNPEDQAVAERKALDLLRQAIQAVGKTEKISIGIDAAATSFYQVDTGVYRLHGNNYKARDLIALYQDLVDDYALSWLEDPMAEDDWVGWQRITALLGERVRLVGDDLFVTHLGRIKQGILLGAANAVLIKPNQVGTVSQTIEAIKLCQAAGLVAIISHRSGETDDVFIADLAVGSSVGLLKSGAPVRGERVGKYNRLLRICDLLPVAARDLY